MFREAATWLFDPSGAAPRGSCLLSQSGLIWLHAISNLAIALACFSIPFALASIIRHRPDLVFRPVFALTAGCVLLCGIGHLMAVLTLWVPIYGSAGVIMAATAVASVTIAIAAWRLMPRILALPSPQQMRSINLQLLEARQAENRMALAAGEATSARDRLAGELAAHEAAEKRLEESQERFQLLLHSNVTEALYLLDPEGNVETWNLAAERIEGYTAAEIIGSNFSAFFTHEDLEQGVPAAMLLRARESGRFSAEAWRVRKDGVRFMARVSIEAIRRPDGSLRGFVKVTEDITDRKIEEEQRAIIVESAPNGMIIADERGIITLANKQVGRILGYPECELAGQALEVLIPPEQSDVHNLLRAARSQGLGGQATAPQQSFVARRRDSVVVTVELMVNTVATPRGHILIAALFDVTERVLAAAVRDAAERRERLAAEAANAELDRLSRHLAKARDRAEEANRAKSRFLAGITHELRTPLHGLLGYAELLTMEGGLNPTQAERLETMMAAGQHLLGMVNAVLDMSQIEADRLELQPADVDLCPLVGVCLNVVRPAAEARKLTLGQPPTEDFHVLADPTRLRQVVINLLGNAVKFTDAGRVEVRVKRADGWNGVRVEVADTGPGIRAAHHDKLFTTFERLNANAVSFIEGTGLGLAISARLIQAMGGRIGYADNPGGGSIFWVELPVWAGTPEAAVPTAVPMKPLGGYGLPLRVLVADDEVLNRSIAGSFLERAGHEVVCVEDGAAAVAAAAAEDFDVILMDVRMPGIDGMEATRLIRNLKNERSQVRIVAVTAQAFAEQIEKCQQAGMDGHLSKPFTLAMLLAALQPEADLPAAVGNTIFSPPALPIFDRQMFRETVEFLPPGEVASHIRTLIARCQAMIELLRDPATRDEPRLLVEPAHKLAGATGMFGLVAVGVDARALEGAAASGAAGMAPLMARLEAELHASVKALNAELEPTDLA